MEFHNELKHQHEKTHFKDFNQIESKNNS